MDIPAADELEWLESNSLLPEFEDDEEDYIVVEEDERIAGLRDADRDRDAASENEIHKKRVRSEDKEDGGVGDEERGAKRREIDDEGEDEDWLRYSPPPKEAAAAADETTTGSDEEKIISRFVSDIEGDCVPITAPNGDRVYAKISSRVVDGAQRRKVLRDKSANGLLQEPIHALINGVEQEVLNKALQESSGSPGQMKHSAIPVVTEQLWVDKYAPNSFTELLSDEQTNREVLLWLKQWDSCVFGSKIRATTDDVFSALRRSSSVHHQTLSDNKFFSEKHATSSINQRHTHSNFTERENNLHGVSELRSKTQTLSCHPEQKVLLLCGPPGLGKTTLAHVAAKHCGYCVVEINASDERSSSTIESKILDVVQMNSVMANSKPKCLVIDEIDGALGEGKGAVEVVLKMVAAERKSSSEKEDFPLETQPGKVPLKKGKQRNTATLLRPIICICNDLYAPALRSLRQVAKVHMFVQPTTSRVVNRLKYICKKEGFKTSSIALSALAEFTECDIRSCLNTLQFLNKKKETLNFLEVDSQVVGQKDMSRSAFDVWKEIFQKRKLKRRRNSMSDSSGHGDFEFLYSIISNRGEYELTMDGIHENFLRLSYHDPMMQKTVRCLDTIGVSDTLLKYILRTQQMSLYAYQPPVVISIRNLVAQFEKPNIEWPKSLQKCRAMLLERKDAMRIWHNKISPSISRHLSVEYLVEDLISRLLHILSPPTLRPVASHLLTEREKNDLSQLVDTMVSYCVTYKASKPKTYQRIHAYGPVSDAPELSFDPAINEFVRFQDHHSDHFELSVAMKQVLVHEVEKRRILRESIGKSINPSEGSNSAIQAFPGAEKKLTADTTKYSAAEDRSQLKVALNTGQNTASISLNSSSKAIKSNQENGASKRPIRTSSSFFDRFRKGSSKGSGNPGESLQKAATKERDSRPLLFKYNEGFTNAVKRPVKIRELLL